MKKFHSFSKMTEARHSDVSAGNGHPWSRVTCSNVFKFTWLRLSLVCAFALINIVIYTQSKQTVFDFMFPRFAVNTSMLVFQEVNPRPHGSLHAATVMPSSQRINGQGNVTFQKGEKPRTRIIEHHRVVKPTTTIGPAAFSSSNYEKRKSKFTDSFLAEPEVNSHDYAYTIQPKVPCWQGNVTLAICVSISGNNLEGRRTIRDTWGSFAYNTENNAILVFFVGVASASGSKVQLQLEEESAKFGDILQENFVDSYNNLSLKSVSILKWVSHVCPTAKFILKADDDMYINVPLLVNTLRQLDSVDHTPSAFIIGSMQMNAVPIRNPTSKWYTPLSLYNGDVYPKYVSGTAYAMSRDATLLLYEASLRVPIFWLEDIYITGLCARKAGVSIFDNNKFSYNKPTVSGCSFRNAISGHRYTLQEISLIHKELYDPAVKC